MGGVKNRDEKRKKAHVYSSGAGGGSKGPALVDKRGQDAQKCPFCERIFKQNSRLKEHVAKKHTAERAQQDGGDDSSSSEAEACAASSSAASRPHAPAAAHATTTAAAAAPSAAGNAAPAAAAAAQAPAGRAMDVGSSAGYYSEKTPKLLLHEWCAHTKRPKPRYRVVALQAEAGGEVLAAPAGGYRCKVVLPDARRGGSAVHETVVWLDARHAAPTEQEAEQRGAVAALHALAGDRALEYVLPPRYRPLWAAIKEEEEQRAAQRARAADAAAVREARETSRRAAEARRAPKAVVMTEERRREVEGVLQELAAAEGRDNATDAGSFDAASPLVAELMQRLQRRGFNNADALAGAAKACAIAASQGGADANMPPDAVEQSALDWLCLNLPEERLPAAFAPGAQGRPIGVLHVRSEGGGRGGPPQPPQVDERAEAAEALLLDPSVGALAAYGFPLDHAADALVAAGGDMLGAHAALVARLRPDAGADGNALPVLEEVERAPLPVAWAEECEALEAIFGEEGVAWPTPGHVRLRVDAPQVPEPVHLHAWCPLGGGDAYPDAPLMPVGVTCPALPPEARLRLTQALLEHADTLLGTPAVYELASTAREWLEGWDGEAGTAPAPYDAPPGTGDVDSSGLALSGAADAAESIMHRSDSAASLHARAGESRGQRLRPRHVPSAAEVAAESARLQREQERIQTHPSLATMRAARAALPAGHQRAQVLATAAAAGVVVISGATGCGKSTQVPQFLLEQAVEAGRGGAASILVTQPRRIAALGLAQRVAAERGERVGETVGYSVRLDTRASARTRLLFCTTGILLRRLSSDPALEGITAVVLDEVHERSLDSDLALMLLRRLLARAAATGRAAPKLLLMSATADADLFASYFRTPLQLDGASPAPPPPRVAVLTIPGFTHPVRELYLEDVLAATGYTLAHDSKCRRKRGNAKQAATGAAPGPTSGDVGDDDPGANAHVGQRGAAADSPMGGYPDHVARTLEEMDPELINADLIEALVAHIVAAQVANGPGALLQGWRDAPPGALAAAARAPDARAVLIFMPGAPEIDRLVRQLQSSPKLAAAAGGAELRVLPLHGSLAAAAQARVFERVGLGVFKVVVATNVAETSITIDDITAVIDTGRVKEMRYDPARGLARLQECWVSQAAAQQRRGRAGRVMPGTCFRLLSRATWATLELQQAPEVLRTPLEGLCLSIKTTLGPDVALKPTLEQLLTPPDPWSSAAAVGNLRGLGALDGGEALTALGRHVAAMPMEPRLAKALVYACLLRCVDPMLTVAAAMANGRPAFVSPADKRESANAAKRQLAGAAFEQRSDHLALIGAHHKWAAELRAGGRRAAAEVASRCFLSGQVMEAIHAGRSDLARTLEGLGFLPTGYADSVRGRSHGGYQAPASADGDGGGWSAPGGPDEYSDNARVVKAALCAGFYPSIIRVDHPPDRYTKVQGGAMLTDATASQLRFFDRTKARVFLHPSSVCFAAGRFESGWLVATEIVQTSKVFVREASQVPVYGLLLFGGALQVHHQAGLLELDGWARFKAPARIGLLVRELRGAVERLLAAKLDDPSVSLAGHRAVDALHALLKTDGF